MLKLEVPIWTCKIYYLVQYKNIILFIILYLQRFDTI